MRHTSQILAAVIALAPASFHHAQAQALSTPSHVGRVTADQAVEMAKKSQKGKPTNNLKAWRNVENDQPDQKAPAAPLKMEDAHRPADKMPKDNPHPEQVRPHSE